MTGSFPVGVLPALDASLENFCGLVIQPGRLICLGTSVFRHQLRTGRRIWVVERVSLFPGFKCGTKLGQKAPFKKVGELLIAVGLGSLRRWAISIFETCGFGHEKNLLDDQKKAAG